ncbi:MAG: hypothetical protein Q7J69_07040 [Candidatus Omnitrophota bacterium]|nr:hypothetical protein [Candidatus Omnitrophota bacterium]
MTMTESPQWLFFMALFALCAVLITLSLLITAGSLWHTTTRLNLLLVHGDHAVQEARRTFGSAYTLLGFVQNFFGIHRNKRHVTNKRRVA